MLRDANGNWVDTPDAIQTLVVDHFQNLYSGTQRETNSPDDASDSIDLSLRELHLPSLGFLEASALLRPFTATEIQEALFDLANNKSPGLDGFPSEFFKLHWKTVGEQVVQAVLTFLTTGHLLKEWNQSLLVLIPKIAAPEEVNHLRPISLCNVVYKCAAKCLVNRMKPTLPQLIDDFQNAFVPGRQMGDNILISHELLHVINKQRTGSRHLAGFKLDMNKAYDRVSWVFILKALKAYGFPDHWVHLIHQCITTVTYRIMINGVASDSFQPNCGLRQGDPLSPYLFLFCMDFFQNDFFSSGFPPVSRYFFSARGASYFPFVFCR